MKLIKVLSVVLCITILLGFSVTAYAASQSRAFTYKFRHQVAVSGSYKANQTKAEFSIYTTSNGGNDTYFTIKQFKYKFLGTNPYQGQATINCCANSSGSCSLTTTKGTKYTYEFWKPTATAYVVGSGTLKY